MAFFLGDRHALPAMTQQEISMQTIQHQEDDIPAWISQRHPAIICV